MDNEITGERPVLTNTETGMKLRPDKATYTRYVFATQFLSPDKKVLEIGSGVGHGALMLSFWAGTVTGIDYSAEAVVAANSLKDKYHLNGVDFRHLPVERMNELNEEFDVITCFEVIEHLSKATGQDLVKSIKTHLKNNGTLIISTPLIDFRGKTYWKFHPHEYYVNELKEILKAQFKYIKPFYQCHDGLIVVDNFAKAAFSNPFSSDSSIIFVCSDESIRINVPMDKGIFYSLIRGLYRNLKYWILGKDVVMS